MIQIRSLSLKGFRSFQDEQVIKFPSKGLMLLTGFDTRNGGSSGTGKSSILEGIHFALGLNVLPTTELKNHDAENMEVTLDFSFGTDIYKIIRTSSKLSLLKNGIAETGMKASLQDKINALMVLPDVFQTLSYRRQDEQGKFFYTEDSKLKSFFSQCIPELDQLESVAQDATTRASELLKQKEVLDYKVLSVKNMVSEEPEAIEVQIKDTETRLAMIKSEISHLKSQLLNRPEEDERIEAAKKEARLEIEKKIEKKNQLLSTRAEVKDVATAPLKTVLDGLEIKHNQIRSQILIVTTEHNTIKNKLESIERAKIEKKEQEVKLADLKNQLSLLAANKCPTCMREWQQAVNKEQELHRMIDSLGRKLFALHQEIVQQESLTKALNDTQTMISELNTQSATVMAAINSQKEEILNKGFAVSTEIDKEISEIDRQIQSIVQKGESLLKTKALEQERFRNSINEKLYPLAEQEGLLIGKTRELVENMSRSKKTKNEILLLSEQLLKIEKDLETETNIAKVLGRNGVLGLIMQGLLSEIEEDIAVLTSGIPNCNDLSVKIQSINQTKSGTTQTKITPVIFKSGHQISFKSLSGGQRSSISLCADLAMFNAIRRRTNITPGFIAFDEVLNGLGASAEAAIESIKAYAEDRLVIMIDHSTEIKEAFTQIVRVEYDGKSSKIL